MADQIAPARESLLAEDRDAPEMAKHRVSDIDRCGREIRLIQRALQKGTGGHDNVAGAGAQGKSKKRNRQEQAVLHTSPLSHTPGFTQPQSGKAANGFGHLITTGPEGQSGTSSSVQRFAVAN